MSLADKTSKQAGEHDHDHNHEHAHNENVHHDHPKGPHDHDHDHNHSNQNSVSDIFELVRNYQGDRFKAVDEDTRKVFYQSLVGKSFSVKNSDFISLDNANFEFDFVPELEHPHHHDHGHHQDSHCDLNVIITHPKRNSIKFTAFDKSVVTFLNEKNFVIKSYVKLNDNKVKSKFYAMNISVVDTQPNSKYVFSFTFTNLDDEDEKIRVYVNHKQPATAGVGRE